MRYTEGTITGLRAYRLAYATWLPDEAPKAVAVLVHGYAEHMGRYKHVAQALVEAGYAVYSMDHRGHGGSQGVRAHVERFDHFVEDLHVLVQLARQSQPDLPLFLIGHSMGALISTRYALRHQVELDGLVLSGLPLVIGEHVSPIILKLAPLISAVVPRLPITPIGVSSESLLSRDPTVDAAVLADPLCYRGKVRARIGWEQYIAAANTRARLAELTLPLLIMHGAEDKIANPQGSTLLYEQAQSGDKTLKLWPGCRHELFNELEQADVIALISSWLDARVRRRAPAGAGAIQASPRGGERFGEGTINRP